MLTSNRYRLLESRSHGLDLQQYQIRCCWKIHERHTVDRSLPLTNTVLRLRRLRECECSQIFRQLHGQGKLRLLQSSQDSRFIPSTGKSSACLHFFTLTSMQGNLTDTYLSNWDCSVHEAFSSYPTSGKDGFQALAIADGITGIGTQNFAGGVFGLPYIISRGATPAGCGDGNWDKDLGEECDDGNIEDGDECSRSCKCESGRAKGDGTCYPSAGDTEGLIRMPEAFIEVDYFTATYMMVVVSVLFQSLWGIVHAATKMIEPFYQLHKEGGASAAESLLSDYLSAGPSMESVMNVFRKHWVMTLTSGVYVFATMGMMVASESMTIRSGNSCNTPDEPLKCDLQWVIDTRIARCLQVFMGLSAAMILARIILDRRRASGVSTYPCTIAATAALLRNPGIMNSFNHIDPEVKSKHIKKALSQNHYGIRRFESPPSIWSYGLVQIAAPKAPVWWHPGNFMTSMKEAWSSVKAYQPGPHPATVAPDQRPGAAPSSGSSEVAVVPPATEVLVEESSTKHKVSPAREALWRNVKLGCLLTVQLAFFGVFLYYRLTDNAVLFVNKTKGVRMGLTAIAILIQFGWQWLEAEVRVMTPYRRLTKPNTESRHVLEMSLHGVPLVTFWRAMWHGNFYHALIAATAVVSQILIIGVAGIPYNFGIIQNVSLFSSTVCLGVLAIQLVVGCSVYWWRRSNPVMPRSPNTIANVVMLLCDSKMLQHFDGLGHSPASEEDLRDRTIGRQYHFGEKQGADGKKRLQIEVREVEEDSISEKQV